MRLQTPVLYINMVYSSIMHILCYGCWALVKEGIRIRKELRLDQLEGFDQLETGLDLGQLVIGLDMICYYLIGPSLGGQECSLYKGR